MLDWLKICDDDLKVTKVLELKFIRYMRFQLLIINLWPRREHGEHEPKYPYYSYGLLGHSIIMWILGVVYAMEYMRILSFFEMGHCYITSMLYVVYMSRLPLAFFKRYRELTRDFHFKIHLFNIKHHSAYAMETHIGVNKITYILMLYSIAVSILGTTLFTVTPIIDNYISGVFSTENLHINTTKKFKHALYFKYPFNTETSLRNYIFLIGYNGIVSWYTIVGVVFIDLYMCTMVIHLWGRFKILIHELESFPRPQTIGDPENSHRNMAYHANMFTIAELPLIHEKLRESIRSHFELMTFADNMSKVFGPILFVYNSFHMIACCLLLLECSQLDSQALAMYLPLTVVLFQHMIELSCVFELLGSVSEKMKDAIYNLPWECMDKSNRLTVIIFLMKVQVPVRVKALGMVNIGVSNMSSILKTSFSYFAFLRTVAE